MRQKIAVIFGIVLCVGVLSLGAGLGPEVWKRWALEKQASDLEQDVNARITELTERFIQYLHQHPEGLPVDDLAKDVVPLLKEVPGVGDVHSNGVAKPKKRLVHLMDKGYVAEKDFQRNRPNSHGSERTVAYQSFLQRLRLLQNEQVCILHALYVKNEHLRQVWLGGVTPENEREYFATADSVKHEEMREGSVLGSSVTHPATFRSNQLRIGACGIGFNNGWLRTVRPFDCSRSIAAQEEGDDVELARLWKCKIEEIFERSDIGVVVLDGGRNLSKCLGPESEYIRIAVRSFEDVAGQQ